MSKSILRGFFLLLFGAALGAQAPSPAVEILIREKEEYRRSPRLEQEDREHDRTPLFSQGLEILTDVEYVAVFIGEEEAGRTPYEDEDAPIGLYRIRLVKPGYEDVLLQASVRQGKRTTLEVRYGKAPAGERKSPPPEKMGAVHQVINPEDPPYHTRILYPEAFLGGHEADLILTDEENTPLITLSPSYALEDQAVYHWLGVDIDGAPLPDGTYHVYAVEDLTKNAPLTIDRRFSRKAAGYFSGFTGLNLVPSAQPLFHKSFQLGSVVSGDFPLNQGKEGVNLPFSFFLRFSPLPRWEAALEAEAGLNSEESRPLVQFNSSQKVLLGRRGPALFSLSGRFSYRSEANDFSERVYSRMIHDPAGASLAVPIQFKVGLWDFYIAPEALYSFGSLVDLEEEQEDDFTGVLRWGISFTEEYFQVGFSTALYSGSLQGSDMIMQVCGEATLYLPRSPLYLNAYTVYQQVHEGREDQAVGLGIGFLL